MKNESKAEQVKEVVQDLTESSLEVGASMFLENLPELGTEVAGIVGNEAINTTIQTLAGGFLGAIAPAFLGVKLSFQQKRFERNMVKMLASIKQQQRIIEQRLAMLDSEVGQKFIDGPYRDVLLDNIIAENQEQKVQYNINGYINLMGVENLNDDIVFAFFHTLSQMNELDIRILRLYRPTFDMDEGGENFLDVMREANIEFHQYSLLS